jgi:RNA polymerase sigma-70 factor (ECF subfamily)
MITEQNKQQIFAEIYNEYFPRLYKYTLYRVGDINAAEDLVSEVFEKVLVKYNTYDSAKGKFSTWLFTIADNTIINYYKKSSRFKKSMDIDKLESKCRLEDLIINRELKENLINAVMCLDERQRSIIALKFGACLNNRQIAQVMDITESNIGTILYRSLKKLKCILKKQDITY